MAQPVQARRLSRWGGRGFPGPGPLAYSSGYLPQLPTAASMPKWF